MPRHSFSVRVIAARVAASLAGFVLFVYGMIAAFSPLPAGAPLAILGVLIIAGVNPAARPHIRRLRRRWRWFDRLVRFVARTGPASVKKVEAETEPGDPEEKT